MGGMSSDGSIWTANFDCAGYPTERLIRTEVNGTLDRSAALPASVGDTTATRALAAASDGSIWIVTTRDGSTRIVHFQPN
jgi:hypothetical protein